MNVFHEIVEKRMYFFRYKKLITLFPTLVATTIKAYGIRSCGVLTKIKSPKAQTILTKMPRIVISLKSSMP